MMKNSCRLLLILIGLWMANVSLAQKTFRNPIITGMNPDPSICRVGDDFYLVTSTFEYFPGLPVDRKSTRLNSSHQPQSRMPSSA